MSQKQETNQSEQVAVSPGRCHARLMVAQVFIKNTKGMDPGHVCRMWAIDELRRLVKKFAAQCEALAELLPPNVLHDFNEEMRNLAPEVFRSE